ncbi:hypothetical protein BN1012_Phect1109 [Candidatus Phaeomarinobacter ectocarpi]|uniref:Sulfotransferase domain-containing protein n=1 Tax=Candidatus Phaeomarinibacter ectocarpi TaxID=1458461 RepID=X5M7X1_9HYPH|nr:hypothetical protein [Candidatus Phaeomarinobacter ectocarpi]CDO59323.1 hypothetical protein BN1012_Phect1109 [Candidatus Phaeomarinobacter ectocarpi]
MKLPFTKQAGRSSVFLVSLPKSGTDFTDNALAKMAGLRTPDVYSDASLMTTMRTGYYPEDRRLISAGNFDAQILRGSGLSRYVRGGYSVSVHMHASHYNIRTAQEAGFSRMTVLMREPRDATISMTYHIRKAGEDLRQLHTEFQFVPEDYHSWPHEKQLAFQVRVHLPRAINWIEGWWGAFTHDYPGLEFDFAYTDDLKQDAAGYLSRVMSYHNVVGDDSVRVPAAQDMAHFRSGEHAQWRHEFSDDDKAFSDALIGTRLHHAYRAAANKHRAWQLAQNAATALDAARASFRAYRAFPSDRASFDKLLAALQAAGNPVGQDDVAVCDEWTRDVSMDQLFQRPPAATLDQMDRDLA